MLLFLLKGMIIYAKDFTITKPCCCRCCQREKCESRNCRIQKLCIQRCRNDRPSYVILEKTDVETLKIIISACPVPILALNYNQTFVLLYLAPLSNQSFGSIPFLTGCFCILIKIFCSLKNKILKFIS